jgi:hypothetical protein
MPEPDPQLIDDLHHAADEMARWHAIRDATIRALARPPSSMSTRAIASKAGLSHQRVAQILQERDSALVTKGKS